MQLLTSSSDVYKLGSSINTSTFIILMLLDRFIIRSVSSSAMFKQVCLGGTFDGIHAGHKSLFRQATETCSERLVVGVTNNNMIKHKILWELIAPVEDRIEDVRKSLTELNPNLTYSIVPINDIYGPTILEKDLECIVVSKETIGGADKINQARAQKGWPELKVHVINLIEDDRSSHKETMKRLKESKLSSSLLRFEKLGSIIYPPIPNDSIPKRPYIIGLTGGVASGKTSIGKFLEGMGFGYINCDLLGHKTYSEIGSPVYSSIVDYFGNSILNETTKQIERSRLGGIVFSDRTKLDKLNELVWPGIFALVEQEIARLKGGHDVIVLENAVLVESGQIKRVHQTWTAMVPPDEAVKRLMETRGLKKEDAEKRVASQVDNLTRVQLSNAVFCTIWEPEVTQQQVRKCVLELREKYLMDG